MSVAADIKLGLRLAGGGGARERARASTVVLSSAVGSLVLLTTIAVARVESTRRGAEYDDGMRTLLAAVIATIATPVVVLVATTARLSAAIRDRRLAGLRLLGLSPRRTRVVAAVESGAGALVGSVLGLALFWLVRPLISRVSVAGRDWSGTAFSPGLGYSLLAVIAVPAVAIGVGLLPTGRLSSVRGPGVDQDREPRRPGVWRVLPLAAGLAITLAASAGSTRGNVSDARFYAFLVGGILCGLGLLIVVPVFTRLLADLLVRVPGRPAVRIAGRRLQSQPAGVSRIVAGLLIGLFIVTGGRMVLGAFEDTGQYRAADQALHDGPASYEAYSAKGDPEALAVELGAVDGVRGAYVQRVLYSPCGSNGCLTAFVGTCADVEAAVPDSTGCSDDEMAWLDTTAPVGARDSISWRSSSSRVTDRLRLPLPDNQSVVTADDEYALSDALQAQVFIPSSTPRAVELADRGRPSVAVEAEPGSAIRTALTETVSTFGGGGDLYPTFDESYYTFVAGLRALVWAVAAIVLAIGLLGFAIAAVDRAVGRRAEMVSLQLVGTPRRVIRAAQWWEASLPLIVGLPMAVALGWSVGSGYLALGDALDARPWQSVLGLGMVSLIAGIGIAGLTVLACAPRIRAELIRRA